MFVKYGYVITIARSSTAEKTNPENKCEFLKIEPQTAITKTKRKMYT